VPESVQGWMPWVLAAVVALLVAMVLASFVGGG
jgi:hypothetical protein